MFWIGFLTEEAAHGILENANELVAQLLVEVLIESRHCLSLEIGDGGHVPASIRLLCAFITATQRRRGER